MKNKIKYVYSPVNGVMKKLEEINDGVFSEKMMGNGVAIQATDDFVYAPMDGKLTTVFHTKHAIGLQSKSGINLLIHIGIDTVNLKGEGFELFVEQGQKVKKGDKLLKVDFNGIESKVENNWVIIVVTPDSKKTISSIPDIDNVTTNDVIIEI